MQIIRILVIALLLLSATCAFAGGDQNNERHSAQHQHSYGG